jgi:hypothetical protein
MNMDRYRAVASYLLLAMVLAVGGCSSNDTQFQEMTPAEIEKQRAEDKIDLEAEDKAEAAFQKSRK